MSLTVRRFGDATAFLEAAGPWLERREAEHNLLLGIARRLAAGDDAGYEPPIYLATVEDDGGVVGCAWRTPPFKVGLTDMPPAAAEGVAADLVEVYDAVPAVMGPEEAATAFARAWAERKAVRVEAGMRLRVHVLEAVRWPARPAPGALRWVTPEDRALLERWVDAFHADAGVPARPAGPIAERWIGERGAALWIDGGEPRSLVAAAGQTAHGVRVGPVYTPPPLRRRGYATTAVATFSRWMLERGRRLCFLYTDLANPTSNAIYGAIGYVPVTDVVDFDFSNL